MSRYWRIDTALCIAVALMAAWATARHPYGYYTLVRWPVFTAGGYMGWRFYQVQKQPFALLFVGVAILFNPVAPFALARSTWEPLDLACAAIFLLGAYLTPNLKM
jgi:hypothetical protein